LTLRIGDEVRQAAKISQMIIGMPAISWASSVYTLCPGDIIATRTCQCVGQATPGDGVTFEHSAAAFEASPHHLASKITDARIDLVQPLS
jgi:2-keto-4-pentenoate hydratase/2-oxohepta-3-ene-1,7-dioic acid hydratase in catechol pathway